MIKQHNAIKIYSAGSGQKQDEIYTYLPKVYELFFTKVSRLQVFTSNS